MKALIIYNPAAGRIPVERFVHGAADALKKTGKWEVDVMATRSGTHATIAARQAADAHFDAVFAVGGDGTVGQVASGLVGSNTAMGILPAGTANVLGIEMGLQPFAWNRLGALQDNILTLAQSQVRTVDVGRCNDRHFLMWAGIGLDAFTVGKMEPRLRWSKYVNTPHYAMQTLYNAAIWRGLDLRFFADGHEIEGQFVLAIVSNIRKYLGGLTTISPDAYLDDGLMDLWLFPGIDFSDSIRHVFDLLTENHLNNANTRKITFRKLRVECDTPIHLQTDGDSAPFSTSIDIEVQIRDLRLLVPPAAQSLLKYSRPVPGNHRHRKP